jgi:hypothetical protein
MATKTLPVVSEELVARLARAAYEVALKHGVRGAFIDVELEVWQALRAVARGEAGRVYQEVPEEVPVRVRRKPEAVAWPA